jgi:hypothetical protein
MTVGILLSSGLEAIVVTDSRTHIQQRKGDSTKKLGIFKGKNYHGAIFGTGSLQITHGVLSRLNRFTGEKLEEFVSSIHASLEYERKKYLEARRNKAVVQSHVLLTDEERAQHIKKETEKALNEPDYHATSLVAAAFDKDAERIRYFYINGNDCYEELFPPHYMVGSGVDGAQRYLLSTLPGINIDDLEMADLAFFTVNAYVQASINLGVGGRPQIAHISKEGSVMIPEDKSRLLANLSGAFMARYCDQLTVPNTRRLISDILTEEEFDVTKLAGMLNITQDALISMTIPYSVWQERANVKHFR